MSTPNLTSSSSWVEFSSKFKESSILGSFFFKPSLELNFAGEFGEAGVPILRDYPARSLGFDLFFMVDALTL